MDQPLFKMEQEDTFDNLLKVFSRSPDVRSTVDSRSTPQLGRAFKPNVHDSSILLSFYEIISKNRNSTVNVKQNSE